MLEGRLSEIAAKAAADRLDDVQIKGDELKITPLKAATPEEARAANADLRAMMAERGNYFAEIEAAAAEALEPVGYTGGALSQGMLLSVVSRYGFAVRYVPDLPRSARSVLTSSLLSHWMNR